MLKSLAKKLTAFALGIMLCLSVTTAVYAEGSNTYTIEEIDNMQFTLPQDMSAVTRASKADDSYFGAHSLDYSDVMKKMAEGDIYLQGMDSSQSITVSVSMFENTDSKKIQNYNRLTGDEITGIVEGFRNNSSGVTYQSSTQDQPMNDIVWIEFELMASNETTVTKQYQANTVINGKSVTVTVQRNNGDVIGDDYQVLSKIISSAKADGNDFQKNLIIYIAAGGLVLFIILLIVIVVSVKRARRRRKKSKNAKILEELATKYNAGSESASKREPVINYDVDDSAGYTDVSKQRGGYSTDDDSYDSKASRVASYDDDDDIFGDGFHDDFDDLRGPVKSFTDEEIDALLGDLEDDGNFNETLSAQEADFEADAEKTAESVEKINETASETDSESQDLNEEYVDISSSSASAGEQTEEELTDSEAADEQSGADETVAERENRDVDDAEDELTDEEIDREIEEILAARTKPQPIFIDRSADASEEDREHESSEAEAEDDTAGDAGVDEAPDVREEQGVEEEQDEDEGSAEDEIAQQEADEFNNDEVLVREEAKRGKFSSSDFFEVAPQKIMGLISREEIEDAEEFDVIDEVEQRASEVEKEPERRTGSESAMQKLGTGFKSFTTHCGYFAKNVGVEFRKSRAKRKRKLAEEERAKKTKEAQKRKREQAANGGLVQVHSRRERTAADGRGRKD